MSLYVKLRADFISKGIQEDIVDTLIEEYKTVKNEALKGNAEQVSLHSGKFSDMALATVKNLVLNKAIVIDDIKTEKVIIELEKMKKTTSTDVILTLVIPRVVRSLHSIRNKKDVAHVKSIDPDYFDIHYCETTCDWILSQLICFIYGADSTEAKEIITSICEKKIPWIEEFEDGTSMLLIEQKYLSDKVILTLYNYYPNRLTDVKISEVLLYENMRILRKRITELYKKEKMVHVNKEGIKLTRKGQLHAEKILEKKRE